MSQFERLRAALAGRYDLGRELGAGGMATVYLATDVKHRRHVALKVLRTDAGAAIESSRFIREIEIAASLVHPNILGVHDSGEADGLLFFVMPYVDGESLRQRLTQTPRLPLPEAVRITRQLADAIGYAHRRGIVHRDIKPENILFESGQAVIADFGVARAVSLADTRDAAGAVTSTGVVLGTPLYMSPEQATGVRDLDGRSDIYSLGCVVFEMLTGQRAFHQPVSGISPEVERVLRRAMSIERSQRYASASDFATALETAAAVVEPKPSNRVWLAAAGLALLAIIGWTVWRRTASAPPPVTALAVLPFSNPDSAPPYVIDGIQDEIISELGTVASLRVISRTSVMAYRGAAKTIPAIARELGVGAIVEGAMYSGKDSVRLQLRLVRAAPEEAQLWSRRYATRADNIQALHAEVTRAIVGELRGALAGGEAGVRHAGTTAASTVDPRAYDAYLRGRNALNTRTAEGIANAETELRRAIDIQPTFAAAHATLATALAMKVDWHYTPFDPIAVSREAIIEANRALELDSLSGEALAARGRVLSAAHAPEQLVRRDFEDAIAVMPQYANAHGWYAMELSFRGHAAESRAEADTSIALDPLGPGRHMGYSLTAINIGAAESALEAARRVVLLQPTVTAARRSEALALILLGRARECLTVPLDPYPALRAMCLHAAGDSGAARRLADSVSRTGAAAFARHGPFADMLATDMLEVYYAYVGNVESALAWEQRASQLSTATGISIYINAGVLDAAKRDPRFSAGVAKLHESIWQRVNAPPIGLSRR